ncbi:putative lactate 2-monooxygenase PB1A11.03 [Hypsizygus marmoreus]|uniref:Lactate 2-monooxygenase PB1A11.03 n=1 Tax=Hypsizygus marmoreus TaxID=39966 RepID=A0A369IXZ6_HYPMA|nr:putative lactate 2-monooxygenase PB1A11.03 [Hypsizygus marmoreus]
MTMHLNQRRIVSCATGKQALQLPVRSVRLDLITQPDFPTVMHHGFGFKVSVSPNRLIPRVHSLTISNSMALAPSEASGAGKWSSYMLSIYMGRQAPQPLGTVVFEEIEAKAKETLKDYPACNIGAFMYAGGSAGTNSTYRANRKALDKYAIIPRMLVNATVRSLETTIFGVKYPSPIFIAPIGVQGIFHGDAELAPARAGQKLGVPFIMSTASSRSIEEVGKANGDGHRWYQLYWPRTNDVTLSILKRAKDSGFSTLVVTLDTMVLGWRPHDLERAYIPFGHGVGIQVGRSDPVFMARYNRQPVYEHPDFPYDAVAQDKLYKAGDEKTKEAVFFGMEWLKECNSGLYRDWEDLKFLRENWEGPLVIKGIQSVLDAEKALEYGVDGIIVSNHGGRQVDGAIPSIYALERIMKSAKVKEAQSSGKLTVLFDSGIRTGSDIIKALALGAQAVLLGRTWLYGLIAGGQAGLEQVLQHTLADLDTTLGLIGCKNLSEVQGKGDAIVTKLDIDP